MVVCRGFPSVRVFVIMSETVPVDAGWGSRARDQKGWLSDRTLSGVPGVVYQGRVAEASDMVDGIVPPNEKS